MVCGKRPMDLIQHRMIPATCLAIRGAAVAAKSSLLKMVHEMRKTGSMMQAMALEEVVAHQPKIVGMYGIPGCGKTFLLNQLKQELDANQFMFYEGSEVIGSVVPGGLDAFKRLPSQEKTHWRQVAIEKIKHEGLEHVKTAVVTGHFMFWSDETNGGEAVYTQKDMEIYTHIIYLDVPVEIIMQRRSDDAERARRPVGVTHLRKWQQEEKSRLRCLCRQHGILFVALRSAPLSTVSMLVRNFQSNTEDSNLRQAESLLDRAITASPNRRETVLVMDADRTLTVEDTGKLFWREVARMQDPLDDGNVLETLFSGRMGHSYPSFRQAALLYQEVGDDEVFKRLCQEVSSKVAMYPEIIALLHKAAAQEHVGVIIITCGLRHVWEIVLEREGLSGVIEVIGGGRVEDDLVVTAAVKAALVARLRDVHGLYVWAFGDSPLDLEMLKQADQAIVVVGSEHTRSKSMDAVLSQAVDSGALHARQLLLPTDVSPRLNITKLPKVQTDMDEFLSELWRRNPLVGLQIVVANENAARLLATPMRDAAVAGPLLRDAHRLAGHYLAVAHLTNLIGLENRPISHVLGHATVGFQLVHEKRTTIVALMRAGEPMASGVSSAFPLAMYVHARSPPDIQLHQLDGQHNVVLVDSVINSGKTVVEFVQAIRKLHDTIKIFVVAGVVQAQCLSPTSYVSKAFAESRHLWLIALRLSETKFKGSGTTDTGNRLYNTTHLP